MTSSVQKFNALVETFLRDLVATVPDSPPLSEALAWIDALMNVAPSTPKLVEGFVDAVVGATRSIGGGDIHSVLGSTLFEGIVSPEDLSYVYTCLSDNDKETCWRYIRKLYKTGRMALVEIGKVDGNKVFPELPTFEALVPMSDTGPSQTMMAFEKISTEMMKMVAEEGFVVSETAKNATVEARAALLKEQYGSEELQSFVMGTFAKIVEEKGLPFCEKRGGEGGFVERNMSTIVQMGALAFAITSVDARTLGMAENLAKSLINELPKDALQGLSQEGIFDLLQNVTSSLGKVA